MLFREWTIEQSSASGANARRRRKRRSSSLYVQRPVSRVTHSLSTFSRRNTPPSTVVGRGVGRGEDCLGPAVSTHSVCHLRISPKSPTYTRSTFPTSPLFGYDRERERERVPNCDSFTSVTLCPPEHAHIATPLFRPSLSPGPRAALSNTTRRMTHSNTPPGELRRCFGDGNEASSSSCCSSSQSTSRASAPAASSPRRADARRSQPVCERSKFQSEKISTTRRNARIARKEL